MRFVRAFGRFWWDFVVGDEWRMVLIVGGTTALGAVIASRRWVSGTPLALGVAIGLILAVFSVLVSTGLRRARRSG